jgi:hypothetical protein
VSNGFQGKQLVYVIEKECVSPVGGA